jgi:hypothetical protein
VNCKMSRRLRGIRSRAAPTRPIFSRSTRSMSAPRGAISAASHAISIRSPPISKKSSSPAIRFR